MTRTNDDQANNDHRANDRRADYNAVNSRRRPAAVANGASPMVEPLEGRQLMSATLDVAYSNLQFAPARVTAGQPLAGLSVREQLVRRPNVTGRYATTYNTDVFLSTDRAIDAGDRRLTLNGRFATVDFARTPTAQVPFSGQAIVPAGTPTGDYYLIFRATNGSAGAGVVPDNNASNNTTVTATRLHVDAPALPAAPSNLRAAAAGQTAVDLAWSDNAYNEAGYRVQRLVDGAWQTVTTTAANQTTLRVTGLRADTAYSFRVLAVGADGRASSPSNVATARTDAPQPVVATSLISNQSRGYRGDTVVARVLLRDAAGRPLAGRLVRFTHRADNAAEREFAAAYTDANGKAQVSYVIPTDPGADNVRLRATFAGDATAAASTVDQRIAIGAPATAGSWYFIDESAADPTRPDTFYPRWYLTYYPDVANAGGGPDNVAFAELHWLVDGVREGRPPNPFFNAYNYMARYSDLPTVFGPTNWAAAAQHWVQFGIGEGRIGN